MKHTLDQLLTIVYQHYPRGIATGDPRWKDAPEHRVLEEAGRAAGGARKKWLAMLARLRARFPTCTIYGDAAHLLAGAPAACYSGTLSFPRTPERYDARIEFQVSFLAPYYVLCSYRVFPASTNKPPITRLTPDDEERPYWEAIAREIETTYEVIPMPAEIGHIIVPDVQPGNRHMGEAMIYDCFFEDCPRLVEREDDFALQLQRE
jgi:hypothetical protein